MATVLCDFSEIVGDQEKVVNPTGPGAEFPLPDFNTGGRIFNQTALLTLSVKNSPPTTPPATGNADIFINNKLVGSITPTLGRLTGGQLSGVDVFTTQLVSVDGKQLNHGNNKIVLKNVTARLVIKNVVCFFHQSD